MLMRKILPVTIINCIDWIKDHPITAGSICAVIFNLSLLVVAINAQKEVDIVVVDKYEGFQFGSSTFFVETCLKNDIKVCKLNRVSHSDYDLINEGETGTLKVPWYDY